MIAARSAACASALRLEVGEVDVAVVVAGDDDDLHAGHLRRRGIGAVRGRRDQADVAMRLAARSRDTRWMIEQARVLALRAGVGLQRHRGVAGGRAQHPLELVDHLAIAVASGRPARTDAGAPNSRPRHRDHLGRRVELHRARAERDHRAVEREVLVGEPAQVAQHLGLGVIAVEHRVREERRRARERRRAARRRRRASRSRDA